MNEFLLIDHFHSGDCNIQICESTSNGLMRIRGKFQEAEAVNKNKRKYPFSVLDENVRRLNEAIASNSLLGELDHPADSIVHLANTSHRITKLWWEGQVLMGEAEILDTPHGRVLRGLINCGWKPGISSRGVGNGTVNESGILVIGESYKLITFDIVHDPSTHGASLKKVINNLRSEADYSWREIGKEITDSPNKNEVASITNFNSHMLIACLDGIFKSHSIN